MMPAYEAPQTNKPLKRPFRLVHLILLMFGVAFALALCAGVVSAFTGDTDAPSSNAKTVPSPMAHPTQTAKAKKASVATTVGNGIHKVGTDVAPGTYKTTGATGGAIQLCYWDTRTSTGDEDIVLGSQGTVTGTADPGMVTLKKGTYFKSQGCEDWTKQ